MRKWREFRKIDLSSVDCGEFWERVKSSCKKKKIIQEELAFMIKAEYPTFRGWSYRGIFPDVQYINYISQALEVSVNYLLFGEEEKKPDALRDALLALIREIKNEMP